MNYMEMAIVAMIITVVVVVGAAVFGSQKDTNTKYNLILNNMDKTQTVIKNVGNNCSANTALCYVKEGQVYFLTLNEVESYQWIKLKD